MILTKNPEYGKKIDSQIFPGTQGGPLMHVIAAKAVAFKEALRPQFLTYQKQILEGLYAAVDSGTITEERLNESVYRILTAKIRVTGWNPFENED